MTKNLEERFAALDSLKASELRVEVARRLGDGHERAIPGPGGRGRLTAAVLALVVFAAAAAFSWSIYERNRGTLPSAPTDPWSWAGEGWTELPPPPETRGGAAWAWVGDRLYVWGGCAGNDSCEPTADGFVFDPASREWQDMPAAPHAGDDATPVVANGELYLLGGGGGDLAFDPSNGAWSELAPGPVEPGLAVWTGSQIIVLHGAGPQTPEPVAAAYDPASDTWTILPPPPIAFNAGEAAWTGHELLLLGSLLDSGNHPASPTVDGMAFDPGANTWRTLPPSALYPQSFAAAWFGDRLVAWDYNLQSQTYDPATDAWTRPGVMPLQYSECYTSGTTVGAFVFVWYCGDAALFDGTGWAEIHGGPLEDTVYSKAYQRDIDVWRFARLVPAGDVVVLPMQGLTLNDKGVACYGCSASPSSLWIYRPPSSVSASPTTEPEPSIHAASNLADEFMYARVLGAEGRVVWLATQDVLDSFGVSVPEALVAGSNYGTDDVRRISPDSFEVDITLIVPGPTGDALGTSEIHETLTLGPGVSAAGDERQLLVTGVRAQSN
jgi:hypothetical protein